MEAVSLKLDGSMLSSIDSTLKQNNYSTRTEFIRDAIREKLAQLHREQLATEFLKYRGKAGKKTTLKQNKETAKKALKELASEMGWTN
ncbi:MAG: ribbon-helix-helix domain-containing protein [Candidatus Woesearchaeota archaeon]